MNLQYLRSFYTTVTLNSISKAAKDLHLTQPGLSLQIQSLEKELGSTLLIRSNKGVELTDAGQIVFDYANTIISIQGNIEKDLTNLKENKKVLSISSCKCVGEYALPCSIYIYKNENTNVDISFSVDNSHNVIEHLLNRDANICIVQNILKHENIIYEKITSDKLLLVTSTKLKSYDITLDELKTLPIISREDGSGIKSTIEKGLVDNNLSLSDLNIIYEMNSIEGIKSSILSGKGFSFIPNLSIKRELYENKLNVVNVENLELSCDYYVAYRKGYNLEKHELDFIKFIKSSKRGFC